MLTDFYVIKTGMAQAWTADGKRLAVTRLQARDNIVSAVISPTILEVGYGSKKEKNIKKPLRSRYQQSGFSFTPARLGGARWVPQNDEAQPEVGATIAADTVFAVGDVIEVRGISKGRGFAGAVKRYGFHGGPKTHGQSDRHRAVGSIGAGTTPGRVWKGKKMPGHYGVETKTIAGLVVIHVDAENQEIWVSGPVPGHINSFLLIHKTGRERQIELNRKASGLSEAVVAEEVVEETVEPTAQSETVAEPVASPTVEKTTESTEKTETTEAETPEETAVEESVAEPEATPAEGAPATDESQSK